MLRLDIGPIIATYVPLFWLPVVAADPDDRPQAVVGRRRRTDGHYPAGKRRPKVLVNSAVFDDCFLEIVVWLQVDMTIPPKIFRLVVVSGPLAVKGVIIVSVQSQGIQAARVDQLGPDQYRPIGLYGQRRQKGNKGDEDQELHLLGVEPAGIIQIVGHA